MIDDKKILGLIPARGGSKRIHRKNVRKLAGLPLIAWTINEAKKSKYIDRLVLSSEDEEILNIARGYGCEVPFIRPSNLATDSTPGIDPVLHALEILPGFDYVVLLQPTSPLRLAEDIDLCIEECLKLKAPCCVSVSETTKNPHWMYTLSTEKVLTPILQNTTFQDIQGIQIINGAVYVAQTEWLKKNKRFMTTETRGFVMPQSRSLDIDSEQDFTLAQAILEQSK